MLIKSFQEILPFVEKPSRYLGSEINVINKSEENIKLKFALAFPDLYEIGTSHFGIQILYNILNNIKQVSAERIFSPAVDLENYLRKYNLYLTSLESKRPLNKFDIIGFSLLYELNYTNILTILDLAGIPFLSSQRDISYPIIIAGGPSTCNPEPISDIFDAIVIGDGELVILKIVEKWLMWKENNYNCKDKLLKMWSEIEGVYVPSCSQKTVKRTVISNLNISELLESPIVPFGKPIHDRIRIEVARGCTRGCRFCQAGMIYRPVRERNMDDIIKLAEKLISTTGYDDISLLSLSIGDYSCILPLMENLMIRCENEHVAISLPSIRAETLAPVLMEQIKRVRKTGFTIAPEAGSQRLRDVINKNLTDTDIINTIKNAFDLGWQVIKLYFMIGLPTETDEDLLSIVRLVKELRNHKKNKGKNQINVSITTFVPKPHTPFQWASQIPFNESKEKINMLHDKLKLPGIDFKFQSPDVSLLEGLWARGDRRLNNLLVSAYKKGCKFDGWGDMFKFRLWKEAIIEENIDIDFFTTRKRDIEETLPWDHIDIGVSKDYLQKEWLKALEIKSTKDCRYGECQECGVCDFKSIKPVIGDVSSYNLITLNQNQQAKDKIKYKKLKVSYSRLNEAKYFGHLELIRIFLRAIKRTKISIKHSEGFHPIPIISFNDTLPIGIESMAEIFYISVVDYIEPFYFMSKLNEQLPKGLEILGCKIDIAESCNKESKLAAYLVTLNHESFNLDYLKLYKEKEEVIITKINKKGISKYINLKEVIADINFISPYNLELKINLENGLIIRPFEIISKIFDINDDDIKKARILKVNLCKENL